MLEQTEFPETQWPKFPFRFDEPCAEYVQVHDKLYRLVFTELTPDWCQPNKNEPRHPSKAWLASPSGLG